ncbi:cytochrome P450 [Diaporthe helianthi]|uniref:Cytochrome P450 n=1 Tax=Diaporthe helianthi TaxID=158607 RepID=A0A2P5HIK7_DIAHE|nr:cytochrome P450 [Diaporthe helianthi]
MACLLSRPDAYRRLVDEIDAGTSKGTLSSPTASFEECRALPYLQAVLNEAMRLFPPLTALASKEVPAGGSTVAGYFLPAGTQVGQNIFGILRDKAYWGDNADMFLPERWLDAGGSRAKDMAATLDLTFGHGKFKCLGRQLALNELNRFIVEVSACRLSCNTRALYHF